MKDKNKNVWMIVIIALIVGVIGFFGGMQYDKSQRASALGGQYAGAGAGGMMGQARRGGAGGGFQGNGNRPVTGQIVSSDDKSITVKLTDGSTKIVVLSDTTTINKASSATKADLTVGEQVTAFGSANSDGSITAQAVSLGNGMMLRGGRGRGQPNPQPTQ